MAAEPTPACCGEWRCTRSQPIRVARSELTGMWYAVTEHAERANGGFEARQKHMLHPADVEQLEAYRLAYQRTLTTVPAEPQDMPAGVEPTVPFDPDRVAADYEPIPAAEVPCRWCGEPLHLGRGGMYRDRANKSVCLGSGDRPPESVVHEPRAAVDG